jgi:hypothetical protein
MDEIQQLIAGQKTLLNKKLSQIINFLGDGKLKNDDDIFRRFLKNVSNDFLVKYAEECLAESFSDSGLALQDISNEIGSRLGFQISHGLYRGNKTDIGFDGIWQQSDDWALIVEVKTTDAYRISLEKIATYWHRLIEQNKVDKSKSSILIIVGRDDTGELEAQIRGSKYAWDIRIISIDSLIQLLRIKESLSDESTAQKISMALRPYEFTRIDSLIDLLFLAIKDVEVEEKADEFIEENLPGTAHTPTADKEKVAPVNFQKPVLAKITEKLKTDFIKQSRSSYSSIDGKNGILISISKQHPAFNNQFDARYWFAFHPHQDIFLSKYQNGYACYGCGDEKHVFMIPLSFLKPKLNDMWKTKNEEKDYKHIVIYRKNGTFYLRTNINEKEHYDDLSQFSI